MTKMTYVTALDVAINAVADGEVREKLEALKAQIAKKNSAERKPTKAQEANEKIKAEMIAYLTTQDSGKSASEIADAFGISNQKASALLTDLVNDKAIVREVIKRKAYFKVACSQSHCGGANPHTTSLIGVMVTQRTLNPSNAGSNPV